MARFPAMKDASKIAPFGLRLPAKLRDQLTKAAEIAGRSLNSEILHRLEGSFEEASTEARLRKVEAAIKKLTK